MKVYFKKDKEEKMTKPKKSWQEKYPGGIENQKKLLEQEGHQIIQKGKKYLVPDYEKSLVA